VPERALTMAFRIPITIPRRPDHRMADTDLGPGYSKRMTCRALLRPAVLVAVVALLPGGDLWGRGEKAFNQPMGKDGRFTNLDGTVPQSMGSVLKWGLTDRLTGKRRRTPKRAPVPHQAVDLGLVATPPGAGEGARLTWLGHAGWLVQLDGVSLLVDPVLSRSLPGGVPRNVPAPVEIRHLPRIDAQLVSHNHYDHMDLPTLEAVGAPVVAGLGQKQTVAAAGLKCTELGWWQSTQVRGVTVTFVPAQHWSRRGVFDANRTLWGGFVIAGPSARVYHAGDTAAFDGFKEIARRFPGLDAALLPIGAYDPAWFMQKQHMSPEQAVQAYRDLGARAFVAMHWGTFKLADEPLDEPPRRLAAEWRRLGLPAAARHVPAVGETLAVRPPAPASTPVQRVAR
jgi:L-ascorbate metabolism protein UlaG (beta-lactamase superfamily)